MAAKTSIGLIVFGVINIVVALLGPCAACGGMAMAFSPTRLEINGRDVGPELNAHIQRKVPGIKAVSILVMSANALCALSMLIGAVGLFLAQKWGRSTTVSAGAAFMVMFCTNDAYQLGLCMPAVNEFLDVQIREMPDGGRPGYKFGVIAGFFLWTCVNPLVVIYLGAMTFYVSRSKAFQSNAAPRRRHRREERGKNDDDDRPQRRRRDDDD